MTSPSTEKLALAEWARRVVEFENRPEWQDWTATANLRLLLAAADRVMLAAPGNTLSRYEEFDEGDLEASACNLTRHLDRREAADRSQSDVAWLLRMAVCIRTLDLRLAEAQEGAPVPSGRTWRCDALECYVVPVGHFRWHADGPKSGQSYSRRGIPNHRIVPTVIDGVDVHLTHHPDVPTSRTRVPSEVVFGAAIFPGFEFQVTELEGAKFLMRGVTCDAGIAARIADQMAAAASTGCRVLIWPELMIDMDARRQIEASLARSVMGGSPLDIVVAGSWHVQRDGATYNEAPVYDGRGELLLCFDKMRAFRYANRTEGIRSGSSIEILVCDDQLVVFAICKDFCDGMILPPHLRVDGTLFLVPSMGTTTTVTAHLKAAYDIKMRFGSRVVAVQQNLPAPNSKAGAVLAAPAEPSTMVANACATDDPFTSFALVRKTLIPEESET